MRVSERGRRSSSAVLIYVIILMAMQVFLVTVAAEAFLADEAGLGALGAASKLDAARRVLRLASSGAGVPIGVPSAGAEATFRVVLESPEQAA
mgnify:CR=1 FL=1